MSLQYICLKKPLQHSKQQPFWLPWRVEKYLVTKILAKVEHFTIIVKLLKVAKRRLFKKSELGALHCKWQMIEGNCIVYLTLPVINVTILPQNFTLNKIKTRNKINSLLKFYLSNSSGKEATASPFIL